MLLLYPELATNVAEKYIIYIPLCFYFIGKSTRKNEQKRDLHSTMLLLYRSSVLGIQSRKGNLHSTMLLLYREKQQDTALFQSFTFHYASTLSAHVHGDKPPSMSFTFHYASTLSMNSKMISKVQTNLHSTMLLLYQSWLTSRTPLSLIYIPLCFYFIYSLWHQAVLNRQFTFHYASTLSIFRSFASSAMMHLHSTMLLLYPYGVVCSKCVGHIYIPLCFYFIASSSLVKTVVYFIYIPLCFYFIHIG